MGKEERERERVREIIKLRDSEWERKRKKNSER